MERNWKKVFLMLLYEAKKLGFAENNPASDLEGNDAAAKIKILSSLAFHINYIKK